MDFEIQKQAHYCEHRLLITSNCGSDENKIVSRISPAIDKVNAYAKNETVYRSGLSQPPVRWILGPPDSKNIKHRVGLTVDPHYLDTLLTELAKLDCRVFSKVSSEVYQLVYISTATSQLDIEEIRSIERIAQINNKSAAVTGILLYNYGLFMQFLEGTEAEVKNIFSAIKKDRRHSNINVLKQGVIPKRQFTNWSMRHTEVNDIRQKSGFIHDKLFGITNWSKEIINNAEESMALLVSFRDNTFSLDYF